MRYFASSWRSNLSSRVLDDADHVFDGKELSDEILVNAVCEDLRTSDPACRGHILINFPKNYEQALLLEKRLKKYLNPMLLKLIL